jgi:3',5'-cyclic AMP phosphodiesterase CpdA
MKLIHISDLHFPVRLPILGLKGKMILGYLNYWFRRRKLHPLLAFEKIVELTQKIDYDVLILSGDITNVSHRLEFQKSREILKPILNEKIFIIPGNHDRYTDESIYENNFFDEYFGEFSGTQIPEVKGYARYKKIGEEILLGLDSNLPTPIASAMGYIDPQILNESIQFLKKKNWKNYSIVCHHPIWNSPIGFESEYHKMKNREELKSILLEFPPVAFFHGHCHTNWIKKADQEFPIHMINSASSTRVSDSSHETGFHLGEITKEKISLKRFSFDSSLQELVEKKLILY